MGDPVRFDIWGVVIRGAISEAVQFLAAFRPGLSRLDQHKEVNASVVRQVPILLLEGLSWGKVQQLKQSLPLWARNITVLQEGYTPEEGQYTRYCAKHDLFYGGCLGCHVCEGFYQP